MISPIDTALAFANARTDQLSELEDFLRGTNVANIEESGDKAYTEGYHQAAKIFFTNISNLTNIIRGLAFGQSRYFSAYFSRYLWIGCRGSTYQETAYPTVVIQRGKPGRVISQRYWVSPCGTKSP